MYLKEKHKQNELPPKRSNSLLKHEVVCLLTVALCSFAFPTNVYTQKVTLNYRNTSLETIFKDIEKQSGYSIFYSDEINYRQPASVNVRDKAVPEALDAVFANTDLMYTITGKYVNVQKKGAVTTTPKSKSIQITGSVFDENNEPVPGATIIVKGTTRGVITDVDGTFTIQATPEDQLEISYLGYQVLTVPVGKQTFIRVTLKPQTNELDEVTIVAFGKQKKESVISSITAVNVKDLKVPSSNLTTAFAGRMAGLISYQRSGEPGQDNADFFIRGVTTFGYKTSPLILIDGIELSTTDLARIHTDDIASFSILKDATATALYGARGANGVILVTTKQGIEGKAKLTVRIENSWSTPTQNVKLADPVTYMRLANEAVLTRDPLGITRYSDKKIAGTEAGGNPIFYPANNWRELLFKDYAMNQRANLNVTGGGNIARYFVSASYSKDNGILKVDKRNNFNNNINLQKYTLRSNVNIDITKSTELIVRLSGNFDNYSGPVDGGSEMYNLVMHSNPVLFPAYYPASEQYKYVNHIMFGNYDQAQYVNPYAQMVRGYKDYNRSQMIAQLDLRQDLNMFTEGLSVRAMFNVTRDSYYEISRAYNPYYYELAYYDPLTGGYQLNLLNEDSGSEYLGWGQGAKTVDSDIYLEAAIDYNRTFNEKNMVSGLLVFIMKDRMIADAENLQETLPYRNSGVSGRTTYSYNSRYFVEFNFGYYAVIWDIVESDEEHCYDWFFHAEGKSLSFERGETSLPAENEFIYPAITNVKKQCLPDKSGVARWDNDEHSLEVWFPNMAGQEIYVSRMPTGEETRTAPLMVLRRKSKQAGFLSVIRPAKEGKEKSAKYSIRTRTETNGDTFITISSGKTEDQIILRKEKVTYGREGQNPIEVKLSEP
ncbi:MAG: SusC/RagA family TonB-linked outer membrane protein [Tannerella sp.]|jgi:TonB-dependent SusC/RagA subfamily outer membrane receptor|nr:SusC/RagA family TonB-linked outer membrane protein [Tannerella sp.]